LPKFEKLSDESVIFIIKLTFDDYFQDFSLILYLKKNIYYIFKIISNY